LPAILCVIHTISFAVIFVVLEIYIRIFRNREMPYIKPAKNITRLEFD
jgi:hypothetical protein